jgi:hypothetical protein
MDTWADTRPTIAVAMVAMTSRKYSTPATWKEPAQIQVAHKDMRNTIKDPHLM